MKSQKYLPLLVALLITTTSAYAQQARIFFDTNVDCLEETYCATVNLKALNNTEFAVGTSSVLMQYNPEALTFKSYESHNFDDNTLLTLEGEEIALYDEQVYDALIPGLINTTMTLTIPGYGEPTVKNEPLEVATVCFDIKEMGADSGLKFHSKHTNFNKGGIADVQLVESLELVHAAEKLVCSTVSTSIEDLLENTPLSTLEVTPNPFKESINLNINTEESEELTLQLFDVKGQLIKTQVTNVFAGENGIRIEAPELASGLYLLEIKGQNFEVSKKLLKE